MGGLAVGQHSRQWDGAQVGSRRARRLLALLAISAGHLVPMDRIVEVLWPTARPQRPAANVATMVSRLRATFHARVIVGSRQGYRVGEQVGDDLSAAEELVATAEAHFAVHEFKPAQVAADAALDLMYNDVLPELPDDLWVTSARALRQRLRRRAWHTSADAALHDGDALAALATAETAMDAEPFDEAACRLVMRACDALDQPASALVAYNRLRLVLADDLGVDPAQPTQSLYLAILRGPERFHRNARRNTSATVPVSAGRPRTGGTTP
jgi:DNA-binding SARP family transcriptional activator